MDPRPDPTTPAAPAGAIRDAGATAKDARVDDRLVELEGLRGLLALWVAVSHLVCWAGFDTILDGTRWATAWKHFAYAQVAVHVFVVMSGFAIWKLLSKGSPTWTGFMAGRVFRLYPVYLPALGLALVSAALQPGLMERLAWSANGYFDVLRAVNASEHRHFAGHLAAHLLLLHGMVPHAWLPRSPAAFFAPGWSLSLEWQFYLVAPLWWRYRRRIATWLVVAAVAVVGGHLGGGNPAFLPNTIAFFANI